MRVLVDLLFFTGMKGGMETYVRNVYSRLGSEPIDLVGLASTEAMNLDLSWFPGGLIDSGISGENRVAWARGELLSVARAASRVGADVLHAPANLGPARSGVPMLLSLHDLLPFRHPEWLPSPASGVLLRWMIGRSATAATRILTVSEASAADIRTVLSVPAEKLRVTPLAAEANQGGRVSPGGVVRPTIFAPGNRMPHKNLRLALEALALIPPDRRPVLELTGSTDRDPLRPLAERLGIADDVVLHNWLSDEELDEAYRRALVVLLPTRFEGFGLPVLEAMTRGTPVICSDLPVLHEVAGSAAIYVDPDDPAALATELTRLLGDQAEISRLTAAGLARSQLFNWDTVAEATAEELHRVARS